MNTSINILHITAHLGGGVGKALSGLVQQAAASGSGAKHTIVTLEEQEKTQFIKLARNCGCDVHVSPSPELLYEMAEASDIVQLEWWNHPATIQALCSRAFPPMRLLVWSHVSGLYNPIIPGDLIRAAQIFLFTSACSFEAKEVKGLPQELSGRIGVVSSCGGFDELPQAESGDNGNLIAGYIGSLNFAKLHPHYVDYLAAVNIPDFKVKLVGDMTNKDILERQCREAGRERMLEFRGYTSDIASELASINVLAYLLNPRHYGTTENALLEAMAMGIVPIVLNNPAERLIVEDRKTGLIVNSFPEFAAAVSLLAENPDLRRRIGREAATSIRSRHTTRTLEEALNHYYGKCLAYDKQRISFTDIFGSDPADWFLSCQGNTGIFSNDHSDNPETDKYSLYGLFEKTKGTVFHFSKYFPDNRRLNQWSSKLRSIRDTLSEYSHDKVQLTENIFPTATGDTNE